MPSSLYNILTNLKDLINKNDTFLLYIVFALRIQKEILPGNRENRQQVQ